MSRTSIKLKRLRGERDYALKMLEELDKNAKQRTINRSLYVVLKNRYESDLISAEEQIFETERKKRLQEAITTKIKTKAKKLR